MKARKGEEEREQLGNKQQKKESLPKHTLCGDTLELLRDGEFTPPFCLRAPRWHQSLSVFLILSFFYFPGLGAVFLEPSSYTTLKTDGKGQISETPAHNCCHEDWEERSENCPVWMHWCHHEYIDILIGNESTLGESIRALGYYTNSQIKIKWDISFKEITTIHT